MILEQTSLYIDNQTFYKVLDWLETAPTQEQTEGLNRLQSVKPPWSLTESQNQ